MAKQTEFNAHDMLTLINEWWSKLLVVCWESDEPKWREAKEWFDNHAHESLAQYNILSPRFTIAATKAGVSFKDAQNVVLLGRSLFYDYTNAERKLWHITDSRIREQIANGPLSSRKIGSITELDYKLEIERHNKNIYDASDINSAYVKMLFNDLANHISVFNNKKPRELLNTTKLGRCLSTIKKAAVRFAITLKGTTELDAFTIAKRTVEHIRTLPEYNGENYDGPTIRKYVNEALQVCEMNWTMINSSNVKKILAFVEMK